MLTHQRPVSEVLDMVRRAALEGMREALADHLEQARQAGFSLSPLEPQVSFVGDLRAEVLRQPGGEQAYAEALAQQPESPLEAARHMTEFLVSRCEIQGPHAAIGLAGLHYPHTHLSQHGARGERVRRAAEAVAARQSPSLSVRQYFAGISDMSFLGAAPAGTREAEDTLAAHHAAPLPVFLDSEPDVLGVPAINIGPWGRDYHQRLERVHMRYACEELPGIVWELLAELLGPQESEQLLHGPGLDSAP
ncbi:hypothetical protein ACFP81_12055 [Deinococcus lacus]|uniref:Peptidase M20 n=1 Tax=Deinococcus lacus TaxID=392561 RepID=A0ABW1YHH2_9DEIO